jgi:hypothetical protein
LLRSGGTLGLIATNTIGQGDTRATGLRWICTHGGEVYFARKRTKWPGRSASVIVSVVHVMKGKFDGERSLDGRAVPMISAYLFHAGGHDDPAKLIANAGKGFVGNLVLGIGFTFDDTDTSGEANTIETMQRLIAADKLNAEVIFPFIGYYEVANDPEQRPHRYVINFGERDEEDCRRHWPDLMAIVEGRVKPTRITKDGDKYPRMVYEWWKFWNARQELQSAIAGLDRVLVTGAAAAPQFVIASLPTGIVYSHKLIVFPFEALAPFAVFQSRTHELWARFFSATLKDDLQYAPSDCLETFPFPPDWETDPTLETAGRAYYDFRAALMIGNNMGLTKTYNRFHTPEDYDSAVVRLRELHSEMDRAVLNVYGWDDIPTDCDFILDYEIDEEEWGRKRKPYRYRWPDEVRDEVLARLIALNAERAAEELRSGAGTAGTRDRRRTTRSARTAPTPIAPGPETLF